MSNSLIKNFTQLCKNDVKIAGGKGASLGEMTKAGIKVPPGFVILSNTFDNFIKNTNLNTKIDLILKQVNIKEEQTIKNASKKIQTLILSQEIPQAIKTEILNNYKLLNSKFVAVRSSATLEDSASAAWAGQLDSYLNTTETELLNNIKKCWASLFTPRAIFYRFKKKLHKDKISVAVIVQKMIDSEESGVAFSVHPVTQDKNQIIIEAGFGLGEAIVSGSITPDNYVIDKQLLKIISININEQKKGLYKKATGGNEWTKLDKKGGKQVLTKTEIIELSKLIIQIEKHYGFPCDIEWAKEKDKFYILQSRPITTLGNNKLNNNKLELNPYESKNATSIVNQFKRLVGKSNLIVLRGNFIPLLLMTYWLRFYDQEFKTKRDIYPVLSIKKDDLFISYINLDKYLDVSREGIQRYIDDPKFMNQINIRYKKIKRKINSLYEKYILEENFEDNNLSYKLKEAEENLHEIVALTLFIDFLDSKIIEEVFVKNRWKVNFKKVYEVSSIYDFPSFDLKNNIEILKWHKQNKNYLKYVYTGYSSCVNDEEVDNKLSKINFKELKIEILTAKTTLLIKRKEKKQLQTKLNKDDKFVADFLSWISEMRDDRKILMNKMNAIFYDITYHLYKNWNIDLKLVKNSYIFEILKGKEYVLDNIHKLKARENNFINLYYGKENYLEKYENLEEEFKEAKSLEEPRKKTKKIIGQIANKGYARGFAKIIFDPNKNHSFMQGEILITSMTRPEFIPIMKKALAIVTNEGGITCHAAIISRELNIPCIIGTKNATEIIHDGDFIEVDAIKGVVIILDNNRKDNDKKNNK